MSRHELIESTAARWLARQDGADWSEQDQLALDAWLSQDVSHRVAWLRLRSAWQQADRLGGLAPSARARVLPAAVSRGTSSLAALGRWWRPHWQLPALAGVAMLVLVLVLILRPELPLGGAAPASYATAVGARKAMVLADGSRVTLNTRTRVRAKLDEHQRQFWLDEGEAFFDVAKDPQRPFVVLAGQQRITVLGTKFSVRLLDGQTQVTVQEGRVRLERLGAEKDSGAVMTGNQSAVAEADSLLVVQRTPEQVQEALSWRVGRLEFKQRTLADIAAEFNRYNSKQLLVHGEVAQLQLGGSFDAKNVDGFVRLLADGFGIKVRVEGEQVHLSQ